MKKIWKDYGLSLVLLSLFLFSWTIQTYSGWKNFQAQQQEHGQTAQLFGDSGYIWEWGTATMENWQSEFLQLLAFVFLTSLLSHKGSPESKDSDVELHRQLEQIHRDIRELKSAGRREHQLK